MQRIYPCKASTFLTCCLIILSTFTFAQTRVTPPELNSDIPWPEDWPDNHWYTVSTVEEIEAQFNAARRGEENQLGLNANTLGNLDLPDNYLQLPMEERAWLILKAEREARHLVNYPGVGQVTGFLPEGVESTLSDVAQGHTDDMHAAGMLAHNLPGGTPWNQRIGNAFPGCTEGIGENIAWNSVSGGLTMGVAFAFYNFIYDDAGSNWGHRNLCLSQGGNNNYGSPDRIGVFGFGRTTGSNGDYFCMDYLDPKPGCTYDINTYETDCDLPAVVTVPGNVYTDEYLAEDVVASDGTIMSGEVVAFKAGDAVNLNADFEVLAGAIFSAEIEDCPQPSAKLQSPVELFASGTEQGRYLTPPHQLIEPPIFRKSHRDY